jgi:hypothetical protein
MAHEIEQEILRQLGGNKFIAMTGAKNFVAGDGILAFRIPKASKEAEVLGEKHVAEYNASCDAGSK